MKTLTLIKTALATLAALAALSTAAPSQATVLYKPDLQPLTYNPGGGADWITQNGTTYRQVSFKNNGLVGAPASLALVRFMKTGQYADVLVVVPPVPAQKSVAVLVPAPFTDLGPGLGLAIKADSYNNMVNETNEWNNEAYLYFYYAPSSTPVVVAGPITVKP
jgi:hypothetical protein